MVDVTAIALEYVALYGLVAIFVLLLLDAAMLLPGLPGEIFMILAVHLYAEDLWGVGLIVLLATAASIIGSLFLYGVGRLAAGRPATPGKRRLFAMSPRRREKLEKTFRGPTGVALVAGARLIPLTRVLVNLPAGAARMRLGRFLVLTLIGTVLFHVGFLWLAYESKRPGSAVAAQAEALQAGYASPAWDYVQANWVLVAAGGIALALVLGVKAAIATHRNPEEGAQGSLVGFLARMTLLWGGTAVLVGLWLEPDVVYETIAVTGFDVREVTFGMPLEPAGLVASAAGAAILLGWLLGAANRSARRKVRRVRRQAELEGSLRSGPAGVTAATGSAPEAPRARPEESQRRR